MARYCIDAETLLHIVRSTATPHASHQLLAPSSIRSDALTLLLADVAAGQIDDAEAKALHTRMTEQRIRALGDRVSRWTAWQIAREQGWSDLHDAEHFAVTRLQADAFVTVDPARAQRAEGIVPTAEVNALFQSAGLADG